MKDRAGMLLVGGVCWIVYLAYVNAIILLIDSHHTLIELSGIPISFVLYYELNRRFVFHQARSWRAPLSLAVFMWGGWLSFLMGSAIVTDLFGFYPVYGHILGMSMNALFNIFIIKATVFGVFAPQEENISLATFDRRA